VARLGRRNRRPRDLPRLGSHTRVDEIGLQPKRSTLPRTGTCLFDRRRHDRRPHHKASQPSRRRRSRRRDQAHPADGRRGVHPRVSAKETWLRVGGNRRAYPKRLCTRSFHRRSVGAGYGLKSGPPRSMRRCVVRLQLHGYRVPAFAGSTECACESCSAKDRACPQFPTSAALQASSRGPPTLDA
jgi:hypothetical protein